MRKIEVEVVLSVTIEVKDGTPLGDQDTRGHWEDLAWVAVLTGQDDASRMDGWADLEAGQITVALAKDESLLVKDTAA